MILLRVQSSRYYSITISHKDYKHARLQIQELTNNSEIEISQNKSLMKISDYTVLLKLKWSDAVFSTQLTRSGVSNIFSRFTTPGWWRFCNMRRFNHYTNFPMQYHKFSAGKNKKKINRIFFYIFDMFAKNIGCGNMLEPSHTHYLCFG